MMLSRMSRNGCETTDMQKMVVVVRQQRNSMKTCRGSDPAIRGIDMISILHNFTANLSPHISQLPIRVDDRVRIDKGRQCRSTGCAPVSHVGPEVKLGDRHERNDAELSLKVWFVDFSA